MTYEELLARVAKLEEQNAAILRVLWTIRGEYKGASGKMEKELTPFMNEFMPKPRIFEWKEQESVTFTALQNK